MAGFLETLCQVQRRPSPFTCQVAGAGDRLGHGRVLVAPVTQSLAFDGDGVARLTGAPWEGPYAPCIDQVMSPILIHHSDPTRPLSIP